MTSKKLIKYAVALQRSIESFQKEESGRSVPYSYSLERAFDRDEYAIRRSRATNLGCKGIAKGLLYSLAAASIGATAGVVFIGNGEENVATQLLYKATSSVIGFIGGGLLAGGLYSAKICYDLNIVDKIVIKRKERKAERREVKKTLESTILK